jgi:glyoxylase-like metal-dependent hydrolase (beta-lactamase superfamily II)
MAWNEVAANLFHRRYQPLDISVGVIRGADGFGVVDTRSSPHQADELRADLRELGDLPIVWVVNTHAHFDHCFGNQRFTPIPIYGHVRLPAHLDEFERPELTPSRGIRPAVLRPLQLPLGVASHGHAAADPDR